MKLNNTIATPLYKQLEEKIRKEIDAGERAAGSRLPTENELHKEFTVLFNNNVVALSFHSRKTWLRSGSVL